MQDCHPFVQIFPKGHFSVQLAMANERVAFSRILFSDKAVAKWEVALCPGQKPISLRDTNIYCYGADAGTGLFIDEMANNQFSNADYSKVFVGKLSASGYKGIIHNFDNHSLAAFSTGYGDGCYATYIGFDEQGNVCRLLTDFGIIHW